jgi:hypothetical protein
MLDFLIPGNFCLGKTGLFVQPLPSGDVNVSLDSVNQGKMRCLSKLSSEMSNLSPCSTHVFLNISYNDSKLR